MPEWKTEIGRRLAGLNLPPAREAAIIEEFSQHLDDCYAELLAGGATEAEARSAALAELSENEMLQRELRRVERRAPPDLIAPETRGRARMIADLWQDLRYGARTLMRSPGFTLIVVATFVLGIGANVALFSVVNGVLLNPLPYPRPEQLVTLHQSKPNFATGSIPYPNFLDWQRENRTFSAMAIARGFIFTMTGGAEAERVRAQLISADLFPMLGVKPALGRSFTPEEDRIGANPVAVISARLWQRRFKAAPDTPGRSLTLDDKSYTIVGVLPASFTLSFRNISDADVYVPIGQWNNPLLQNRDAGLALQGLGRIKPGLTIEQAQADLERVARNLAAAYPETNRGHGARIVPLKERIVGNVRPTLLMLFGAAGFVLLIACVNVSNLLLARSTGRTREFAIRAALGAGQWRLIRQLLTESLLLALAGGGLGLLIAGWSTRVLIGLLPDTLPRAQRTAQFPARGPGGLVLLGRLALADRGRPVLLARRRAQAVEPERDAQRAGLRRRIRLSDGHGHSAQSGPLLHRSGP